MWYVKEKVKKFDTQTLLGLETGPSSFLEDGIYYVSDVDNKSTRITCILLLNILK